MSFSSDIKIRLCSVPFDCGECAKAELAGLVGFAGHESGNTIRFNIESEAVAKRLESDIFDVMHTKTGYAVQSAKSYHIEVKKQLPPYKEENECCRSAYIRGAFLGGGSVNSPDKNYHLEFASKNAAEAERLYAVLEKSGFTPKKTMRKGYTIVYFKDCDSIAEILGLMGEGIGGLKMFETQIEKQMRNDINRLVNCENANTDKLAKAASKHIYAITKLQKNGMWAKLSGGLREIGELRCQYPEDSLKELGERLNPPIGKSGVNHRLNRIMELAEDL